MDIILGGIGIITGFFILLAVLMLFISVKLIKLIDKLDAKLDKK